jgi:hypothetical protein
MKIQTTEAGHEKIREIFEETKRPALIERTDYGRYVTPGFKIEVGVTEYTIRKLHDRKWRLVYVNTYGNVSGVYGDACDASGFVVTDPDLLDAFEALADWGA